MTLLIGIDEAGYGPNYGPLCIGATAWLVPTVKPQGRASKTSPTAPDLYQLLADIITPTPTVGRIAIADSKQLYKPASHAKGKKRALRHLERAVLSALSVLDNRPADWRALIQPPKLPWYRGFNCPLPIDEEAAEIESLAARLADVCETASVRLIDVRTRLVFPQEFNELTEKYGTKGAALSHISMELLNATLTHARLTETRNPKLATQNPFSPISITCDKHGGRNRYAALLQHHFPDHWIETLEESRPSSRYRWGGNDNNAGKTNADDTKDARTEINFRSKGEAELPVALASMAAKYHRELAMRGFNAFWAKKIPGLRPTAGYPQDAKRFQSEIATVQSKLNINPITLWRNR